MKAYLTLAANDNTSWDERPQQVITGADYQEIKVKALAIAVEKKTTIRLSKEEGYRASGDYINWQEWRRTTQDAVVRYLGGTWVLSFVNDARNKSFCCVENLIGFCNRNMVNVKNYSALKDEVSAQLLYTKFNH